MTKDLVRWATVITLLARFYGISGAQTLQPAPDPDEPSTSIPAPAEKVTIGEVEDVMLRPWSIKLPARIDTGATISSLDARDITVRNDVAEFTLGKRYGGYRLRLPIVDWVYIRNAVGEEKRPVVKLQLCIGPKLIDTVATLKDRSQMSFPFLVGRNVLSGAFLVDTSLSRAARPHCRLDALPLASAAPME